VAPGAERRRLYCLWVYHYQVGLGVLRFQLSFSHSRLLASSGLALSGLGVGVHYYFVRSM